MIKTLFPQRRKLLFFMRLTMVNIILSSTLITIGYASEVHGQEVLDRTVTLDVKNTIIKEVLSRIEEQTKVKFTYRPKLVKANKKVSLNVEDVAIRDVLNELFSGFSYRVIDDHIVLIPIPAAGLVMMNDERTNEINFAQNISGKVTDESGAPLPGVNILEKGTTNGAATDAEGQYHMIVAGEQAVLVFTFIGYASQEVLVGPQTTINIQMTPEILSLDEVVVTAFGIQREQKSLGYAVQNVSGENLQKVSGIDVATSLTGKVAGVLVRNSPDFGALPQITVRGEVPLMVIDGVPYGNKTLSDISSEDIESISVLKGATASALYGVRGANGAVIITTKNGSTENEDLTINFTSNTMYTAGYLAIPEKQSLYGRGSSNTYNINSDQSWGVPMDGTVRTQWDPISKTFVDEPYLPVGKNNFQNFLEQGYVTNNNLSIAYQKNNVSFRNSFNWAENKGRYPNSKQDRYTYLFGVDATFNKFKIGSNASYARRSSPNLGSNGYTSYDPMYTLLIWSSADFDIREYKDNYWIVPGQIQNNHFGLNPDGTYKGANQNNPYFDRYEKTNDVTRDIFNADLSMSYDVADWLNATVRSGLDFYKETGQLRTSKGSYLQTGNTPVPGNLYTWNGFRDGGYVIGQSTGFSYNTDFVLTGQRSVQKLDIDYLAGGTVFYKKDETMTASTQGGISVPDFFSIAASVNPPTIGQNTQAQQVNSLYGRLSIAWNDLVYLEATGRNDWASTLPSGDRSYFYPSLASSIVVSELLPDYPWLDMLKIRNSYTVSKGIPGVYEANSTYSLTNATWGTLNGASAASSLYPPGLHPQVWNTYETGLQGIFFENRLSVDVAYYNKEYNDRIISGPLSQATGYSSTKVNSKEILITKGWEVALKGTILADMNWQWDVGGNWTTYKTVYDKLDPDYSANNAWTKIGERTDVFAIQRFLRSPSNELIFVNGRYQKSPYYSKYGYSNPDYVLGLNSSLKYKAFSLWLSFDGVVGGLMSSRTESYMWQSGGHPDSLTPERAADVANQGSKNYLGEGVKVLAGSVTYDSFGNITSDTREFGPNDVYTTYLQYIKDLHASSAWGGSATEADTYSKTFFKLREISLTYQVPTKFLHGIAKSASVGFVGQNVLLWTKDFKYSDPDGGSEDFADPAVRFLGFNVKITL